jgi:flagellar hook-associated protein 1 FlgK
MSDIMSTSLSALYAYKSALTTVSNNIANANTPGYSRQSVLFAANASQKIGSNYIGSGVSVASIQRNVDNFVNYQVRSTSSVQSQYDTLFNSSAQIDQILSGDGSGISASLQLFSSALGAMTSNPADRAARNVVLQNGQLLADRFKSMQGILTQYQADSTKKISQSADQINILAKGIADINKQMGAGSTSPDLLDKRDNLLQQLSSYSDLNVITQSDGSTSVGFGNGQMLVTGTTQHDLSVSSSKSADFGTKLLLGGVDVTASVSSGSIKGQLDFETKILGKASQSLGLIAIGLAGEFNTQQSLGVDLNNQLGGNFFTDFNSAALQEDRAISFTSNTGTAVVSVSISDTSQIQLSDYNLTVTDAATNQYSLVRKSDGTSIPLTWDSSGPSSPATLSVTATGNTSVDGISITVDDISRFANNDRFTLVPTGGMAGYFNQTITDFRGIAAASPVRTQATAANTGSGQIALGTISDTSAVNTPYTITIDPSDATQYTVSGDATVYTLTPGSDNVINIPSSGTPSFTVVLSGTPSAGDSFSTSFNSDSSGDNSNGLQLAKALNKGLFSGGSVSVIDQNTNLISDIGALTNDSKLRSESAGVLSQQAISAQDSKSGVNMDEEGGDLIKYQAAFAAVGKLMQIVQEMNRVILDSMR